MTIEFVLPSIGCSDDARDSSVSFYPLGVPVHRGNGFGVRHCREGRSAPRVLACHRFAAPNLVNEPISEQTCRAAYLRNFPLTFSFGNRWRTQAMDRRQDAVEQRAADRDFGELESDGPGMSNNSGTNLDQPGLKAGQRPIGHLFGQISALPT
jgi:hypothetical protein